MPIYDYACPCGKTFEALVRRPSDEEELRCPACEGAKLERLISQPGHVNPRFSHEYRRPDKVR
ncbi:MAG TPA: zinc ribbon domain-containing protein [Anaeromyxobacteraceae bacterium]|nr:zinc ribbon domain-containing protein [Anaeromyxobacteraceae bacterium]